MADAVHPTFATLLPRPSRSALAYGALIAVLSLVVLNGGVAAWAQLTVHDTFTEQGLGNVQYYSLTKHVLAMIFLATYAVGIACTLVRERQPILAVLVLIGTAVGPMSITAAPVDAVVVTSNQSATVWWWQALVQGCQLLIMGGWTWWTARCIRGKRLIVVDPAKPDQTHGVISSGLLFSLYCAVTITAQILTRTDNGLDSAGLLPIIGWAVLGAGGAVIVLQSAFWPAAGITFMIAVFMLGTLYDAYYRPGGWPGVAGWENGMQSPIILSFSTSVAVLAGPLAGAVLRRRHPPAGALAERAEAASVPKPL